MSSRFPGEQVRSFRFVMCVVSALLLAVAVVYICNYKIFDVDFWWHLKAGELMWRAKSLIHTDPFSYTRVGQPYNTTHEWLAEVLLFLVYRAWGIAGIVLIRWILIFSAVLCVLLIDPKSLWPNAALGVWTVLILRSSLHDRAQLSGFVFFALFLWGACLCLRDRERASGHSTALLKKLSIAAVIIQILWVNMHGSGAVMGLIVVGAVYAQTLWEHMRKAGTSGVRDPDFRLLGWLLVGLLGASLLLSPNTYRFITDMIDLAGNPSFALVREWQPRGLVEYIATLGIFLLLAVTSLSVSRRHVIFSSLLLLVMTALSMKAYRHGMLFTLTAVALTCHQLATWAPYQTFLRTLLRLRYPAILLSIAIITLIGWAVTGGRFSDNKSGMMGYGTFAEPEAAYNFIEKTGLRGKMFNGGNIAGYLDYRGSTRLDANGQIDRPLFYDGLVFDFSYPFIAAMNQAAVNDVRWKELEDRYGFTYAIIDYQTMNNPTFFIYAIDGRKDPSWRLVYLDDWIAIYAKAVPENATIIRQNAYAILTPEILQSESVFANLPPKQWATAESELRRIIADDNRSIRARLILARHLLDANKMDEAETLAQDAHAAQPYAAETFELLGMVDVARHEWSDAGSYLEQAIALTSGNPLGINYEYLSTIFSNAGETDKAEYYHRIAVGAGQR